MASISSIKLKLLSFNIVPRLIQFERGKKKVVLAAVLQPQFGLNSAEIVASVKKGREKFAYSKKLRQYMYDNGMKKADFKPLEAYLVTQITLAKSNLAIPLANLEAYLKGKAVPTFIVDYQP